MEAKHLNENLSVIITFDSQPYSIIENEEFLKDSSMKYRYSFF